MTLHTQLMTMIAMIVGGMYLGFATETYRMVIYQWRRHVIVRYGLDIFYWLLQTALLFYLLYRVNHGELRFYVFLACLLGFSMYVVLCMPWYRKLLYTVLTICRSVVRWTAHILYLLLIQPLLWIGSVILTLLLFLYKTVIKTLYFCLYPFIWLIKKYVPTSVLKKVSQITLICSTMIRNIVDKCKKAWQKWR